MLAVEDIHTYYGESYVLQGVSLEIGEGSVVALLGRNGMGKTTTIRTIMGLTPARSGRVRFRGTEIGNLASHRIAQAGIALVPQGRHIFPSLTVEENLVIGARGAGRPDAWTLDRVYGLFPLLRERRRQPGALLSGGQQQILAICRALLTNPSLLLLDEPSEGLSPTVVAQVSDVIAQLKASGLSILIVEQNVALALGVADHVYILSKGRVAYTATPQELREDERVMTTHLGVTG